MDKNQKELNENIDIFVESTLSTSFKMFKIIDDLSINITPDSYNIVHIKNDIYKINITLPNDECIVCCLFNGGSIFIRVGDAPKRFCLFLGSTEQTEQTINYTQFSTSGDVLEEGVLDDYNNGFYGYILNTNLQNVDDFIGFDNNIGTLKMNLNNDYNTTIEQTIYYDWE